MPTNRALLGTAAFSLALAGGGVAGALLGTPSTSGAQDPESTTATEDAATTEAPEHARWFGPRGERLSTAAEALGITEEELRTALSEGQSIADVAEAEGVDLQTVVDALVAAATEELEELQAELPEHMTELVNREGWGDHERPGRGPGRHGFLGARLDTAAEAIGITADELRTALQDGSTIAEVAEANGVDVQTVIDALVAEATAQIDAAVADGTLESELAEEMKANLGERITAHVNGEGPFRGPGAGAPPPADAD